MLTTRRYTHPVEFYSLVHDFLMLKEAENNLSLGILTKCLTEPVNSEHIFIATQKEQEVVFLMMQTAKKMIVVGDHSYVDEAVHFLQSEKLEPKGIISLKPLGLAFAKAWQAKTGNSFHIGMDQRIYRLDTLQAVRATQGKLRIAQKSDESLLGEWFYLFALDMGEPVSLDDARNTIGGHIEHKRVYVWENEEVVSMARSARPTENGVVVNSVFTPEKFRGNGYASACVHGLSRTLLESYQFCTLYTDLANPTSNSIYMKMGYKAIADSVMIVFQA